MSNSDTSLTDAEIAAIARGMTRPLVLVGMMGVGKSSIGRRLAQLLGLEFMDADTEIEEAAQMSVSEIFATFGEEYFRDGERRVIARLMEHGPCVIATGGGAFVNAETRALVLEQGLAIWLDSDVDTLVERVGRKDTRPLLRDGDPREILGRLRSEREPFYAQAQIHVVSEAKPHHYTLNKILQALKSWQ